MCTRIREPQIYSFLSEIKLTIQYILFYNCGIPFLFSHFIRTTFNTYYLNLAFFSFTVSFLFYMSLCAFACPIVELRGRLGSVH